MVYYRGIKKSIETQDKSYQKESEDKCKIVIVIFHAVGLFFQSVHLFGSPSRYAIAGNPGPLF
jgi:hypothetical protein